MFPPDLPAGQTPDAPELRQPNENDLRELNPRVGRRARAGGRGGARQGAARAEAHHMPHSRMKLRGYSDQAGPSQLYQLEIQTSADQFSEPVPAWDTQDRYMIDWNSDFLGVSTTAPGYTTVQDPSLFFQSGQE
ncbi:hypothetical protein PIB30_032545 [Stylosanthes scabra]|uniref:Uncharacterized protein n=1 Tax=Stylosanthes scabra TaxID=79078 RepID=A0ABU6Z9X4_9FABA|nr:hypothetical protein [Stylosanthes scabra]